MPIDIISLPQEYKENSLFNSYSLFVLILMFNSFSSLVYVQLV